MTNIAETVADIRRLETELNKQIDRTNPNMIFLAQRRLALGFLSAIIRTSPVDTGRFRGNWHVSINRIRNLPVKRIDKDGSSTLALGIGKMAKIPDYSIVYVSNNVDYALDLNRGKSKQAPPGFVELALREALLPFDR